MLQQFKSSLKNNVKEGLPICQSINFFSLKIINSLFVLTALKDKVWVRISLLVKYSKVRANLEALKEPKSILVSKVPHFLSAVCV